MYAIVKLGGKQWKLQEKDKILVDKLDLKKEETFLLEEVLLLRKENDCLIGDPFIKKVSVQVKVLEQTRDKKIIVFKKKRRKGYKKKQGHRQYKSLLLVEKILLDGNPIKEKEVVAKKNIEGKKEVVTKKNIEKTTATNKENHSILNKQPKTTTNLKPKFTANKKEEEKK